MSMSTARVATAPARPTAPRTSQKIGFPYALAVIVFLGLLWEAGTRWGNISPIVLPRLSAVLVDLATHSHLFTSQAAKTLIEIVVGFAASLVIAVPLAVLLSTFRIVERTLYPLLVGSQTVPVVSIAPILLAWFGFGLLPKVIVVVLITFFPIMMNTYAGMKALGEEISSLARSMGASRLQFFWHFQLPGALPSIFAGMKIATNLSVVGAVVAEFVGSDSGLGYEIMLAGSNLNLAHQFAAVGVLSMLGLILFSIMNRIEHACLPWHVSVRTSRK
jgi:NitT/TauT family transport system permease protein